LNDKVENKPSELEQSATDYTMAEYTMIGGVKKKKKKKVKRKLLPPTIQEPTELPQSVQPAANLPLIEQDIKPLTNE
jgi:hypothetical protein